MPRPEKVAVVEDVKDGLTTSVATILTEYRGLSVGDLAELRARLREADARYRIAKNTLARIAAHEAEVDLDELLVGPTALVFCDEDPVAPAKALKAFQQTHPALVVKGGFLDGEVLDAEATTRLADLSSREELLEELAGLMYGALANVARLLDAAPQQLARLLGALEHEGGAQARGLAPGGAAEEPAAAEPADDDESGDDETGDDETGDDETEPT